MRSHTSVVAVLELAALPIGALAAWAADRQSKPLVVTLIGSDAVLGVTDTGAKGPTPGDLRTLRLALSSTGGKAMGRAEIVQVLTRQAAASGTAIKTVVLNLAMGTIGITGTISAPNSGHSLDDGCPADQGMKYMGFGSRNPRVVKPPAESLI